mgnify:CR=1 FL=1
MYSNYSHATSTTATVGEDELPWTNAWSFWGTCRWELDGAIMTDRNVDGRK